MFAYISSMPELWFAISANLVVTLVLVATNTVLYFEEKEPCFKLWAWAFVFYSARFAFDWADSAGLASPVMTMLLLCSALANAGFLFWGTFVFLNRPLPRWVPLCLAVCTAWIVVTSWGGLPLMWRATPVFLLMGLASVFMGWTIGSAPGFTGICPILTGWSLVFWGICRISFPVKFIAVWFAPWVYCIAAVFGLTSALGLILIYFRQSKRQMRQLTEQLAGSDDAIRKRIAESLHDNVGQLLALLEIKLDELQDAITKARPTTSLFFEFKRVLGDAAKTTRRLITDLYPTVLYEIGLNKAFEWLCAELLERHSFLVELKTKVGEPPVPLGDRLLIFGAVRELLYNSLKHSGTNQAYVRTGWDSERMEIMVEDKGKGFAPGSWQNSMNGRFGLFSIRERIAARGGEFGIRSGPGEGACVSMTIPLGPE